MNMRKEYRKELAGNHREGLKLWKSYYAYCRTADRMIAGLEREKNRAKARTQKQESRLLKRRAILEGRLS